jgi:hypothetical protein
MDERIWMPRMKRFIERLIERSEGRAVLQFNRVDFRLPWLRRHFPGAQIVHIYRHPRDQWCSTFLKTRPFPPDGDPNRFAEFDEFYLLMWVRDLRFAFPFLDEREVEHPYEWFYYLWRLSYLFGRNFADHSLALEHLVEDPRGELARLFESVAMRPANRDELCGLVERPRIGKWRDYAPHEWFARHESRCETALAEFFGWREEPPAGGAAEAREVKSVPSLRSEPLSENGTYAERRDAVIS